MEEGEISKNSRQEGEMTKTMLGGKENLVKKEMRYPMTSSSPHLVVFNLG